jgi:hypothetical protein
MEIELRNASAEVFPIPANFAKSNVILFTSLAYPFNRPSLLQCLA